MSNFIELVPAINELIKISIFHGGDQGGPYCIFSNEQKEAVEKVAQILGCSVEPYEWGMLLKDSSDMQ